MSDKNIHQRIAAVMEAVAYVQKEEKRVNNQYRFVSHDAVTASIQPELVKHGIVAVPTVTDHSQDGNRTSVDLKINFINVDKPDDYLSVEMFGYGVDTQDKGPGKAFSYAKKYAFLQLFCLSTGDDPERDNIDHDPETEDGDLNKKKKARVKTKVAKDLNKAILDLTKTKTQGQLSDYINDEFWKNLAKECKEDYPDMHERMRAEYKLQKDRVSKEVISTDQLLDDLIAKLKSENDESKCAEMFKLGKLDLLNSDASAEIIAEYESSFNEHMGMMAHK